MADLQNLVMLVCATMGSMFFGVLVAYWMFRVFFALIRPQKPMAAIKAHPEAAGVL